jgi:hypothetical protein
MGQRMQLLVETEYLRVEYDADREIILITRSARPFPSTEAAIQENANVSRQTRHVPARFLILDSRMAPGRNDDSFESAMRPVFTRYVARYERVGMIVQTAIGRLQMQRLSRTAPIPVGVCSTLEDAIAFVLR